MISTRVMDIKLREAAEGLGEDSTGETLASPTLGRVFVCWGQGWAGELSVWRSARSQPAWIAPTYAVSSSTPTLFKVTPRWCSLVSLPNMGDF
jgi:hypothetical protein